ncbi:MAG TPA: kinase/pyrophosphorylase [Clostridia bacterium]|jgi:hypothetical protein|nr:kinase/pyrophosphorylase [Clostridia bacterium]
MEIKDQEGKTPIIFVVSDSVGETAEFVVRAAASQYNSGHVVIKRLSYVSSPEAIEEAVVNAAKYKSIIVYTLVSPELKEILRREAEKYNVYTVDILGPVIDAFAIMTGKKPKLEAGLLHRMDEKYFQKIEAIEFAVKYDDGKDPRGLIYADIILVGISRTSKTPVSMYLANKRLKVANVPLVPEVAPPEELFMQPANKIIGLTIDPIQLTGIRQARLKALGLSANADYASLERILEEIEYAQKIMKKLRCPIIDVTNKAIEETANEILNILRKEGKFSG